MTFIMLAILYGVSLGLPVLFYVTLQVAGSGSGGLSDEDKRVLIDRILIPGAYQGSVETALSFGIPLLIVLTAASFGGEFAWGTIRLLLSRGESRGEYVGSKTVAIACWWFVAVAGATVIGIVMGALLGRFEDPAVPFAMSGADLGKLASSFLGAWLGGLVYVAITASITVNLRSTAFGLAAGLTAFYGERIVGGILPSFGVSLLEWITKVGANYNLRVVIGGEGVDNPVWFAWAILAIYTVTALVATVRLLKHRDISGPTSA